MKETGADRSVPPGRGRGGVRTRGRERCADRRAPAVREGERARGARLSWADWAEMAFPFPSKFLIHFLFIFSMDFKSNHNSNSNNSNMCIKQKKNNLGSP